MRAPEERAASDRRVARPVLNAAAVALALLTVLLALLFVAVVLVTAAESLGVEATRSVNVASAVGEALFGGVFTGDSGLEPSARVCWFSRACR